MALLKPDIAKALRAANLTNETGDESISELMDKKGLTPSAILDDLNDFITTSTNEPLRLKAIELALKMKGMIKPDTAPPLPSITIIIKDDKAPAVDPILIPRQYQSTLDKDSKNAS